MKINEFTSPVQTKMLRQGFRVCDRFIVDREIGRGTFSEYSFLPSPLLSSPLHSVPIPLSPHNHTLCESFKLMPVCVCVCVCLLLGVVYKALDLQTHQHVALKVEKDGAEKNALKNEEEILRELELRGTSPHLTYKQPQPMTPHATHFLCLSGCRHVARFLGSGVVDVDCGASATSSSKDTTEKGQVSSPAPSSKLKLRFFALELLGSSVSQIKEAKQLSLKKGLEYAIGMLVALTELHEQGFLHKDIKPV